MIQSHEKLIALLDRHIMECTCLPRQYIGMEIEFFCFKEDKTNLDMVELEGYILLALRENKYKFSRDNFLNIKIENTGCISYEPGGQLEFSSQKEVNVNELLKKTIHFLQFLINKLKDFGYSIFFTGCNPRKLNQKIMKPEKRYLLMQKEFDEYGIYGRYMMLNTASIQVNVDFGSYKEFGIRWRNLHLFYPIFVTLFGNSTVFNKSDTGYISYRQHIIEQIGGKRVKGLYRNRMHEDTKMNISNYCLFLYENNIFSNISSDEELLKELLHDVFPIVRIREYFEVRYFDDLDLYYVCCPIILIYVINYDLEMQKWVEKELDELYYLYQKFTYKAIRYGLKETELRTFCSKFINKALEILKNRYQDIIEDTFINRLKEYWEMRIEIYDE